MGRLPIITARTTPCHRGTSAARADCGGAVVGDARYTAPLADDGGMVVPRAPGWRTRPPGFQAAALSREEDNHGRGQMALRAPLQHPTMVTAFGGWIDAGETAT